MRGGDGCKRHLGSEMTEDLAADQIHRETERSNLQSGIYRKISCVLLKREIMLLYGGLEKPERIHEKL